MANISTRHWRGAGVWTLALGLTCGIAPAFATHPADDEGPLPRYLVVVDDVNQMHMVVDLAVDLYSYPEWLVRVMQAIAAQESTLIVGASVTAEPTNLRASADYLAIVDTWGRVHYVDDIQRPLFVYPSWISEVIQAVGNGEPTMMIGKILEVSSEPLVGTAGETQVDP